jgi:hypothetical protein
VVTNPSKGTTDTSDGFTYKNDCERLKAGVALDHDRRVRGERS